MIKHLAIVMDGNRRWAKKNYVEAFLGHSQGTKAAQRAIDFCLAKNISYLSLWALSTENYYKRSKQELNYLFDLLIQKNEEGLKRYKEKNVKVRFVGDRSLYPEHVLESCKTIEEQTKNCSQMQLNILFCYGGRQEIVAGVKDILNKIQSGEIIVNDINSENFSNYLWLSDSPEPEIIIRAGNRQRISNFIMYQGAYSEIYFLKELWPEINETHLQKVLDDFANVQRNFGV